MKSLHDGEGPSTSSGRTAENGDVMRPWPKSPTSPAGSRPAERLALALAIVGLAVLSGVGSALAQSPFTAEVTVEPSQLVIGDVVRVTASVNHPAGYTIGPLELDGTWGPFEVRALEVPVTVSNLDGSETTSVTFEAQVFEVGELTTPELTLTVRSPSGSETRATAAAVAVTVESVLRDTELRDIRPQAQRPGSRTALVVGSVFAGLAAVLVAALAYRHLRGVRSGREVGSMDGSLPPYEWAVSELARIEALGLPGEGRHKEHYVFVSEVVRRYLDGEVGVDAVERTTAEVSTAIRESAVRWRLGHRVLSILFISDLVKFARYRPTVEEADALVPDATGLVHDLHREVGRIEEEAAAARDGITEAGPR